MGNWKSLMAFIVFIVAYVYTVGSGADPAVVATSGYIALYSSLFMMMRSQMTTELLGKIVDNMKMGK